MIDIELSPQQFAAKQLFLEWFNGGEVDFDNRPIFRLFGFAGTGKTTLIKHLISELELDGSCLFGAYTGKAAMVMRKQSLPAQTIHSLIYQPVPPDKKECEELHKRIQTEENPDIKKELKAELRDKSQVHFVLKSKGSSDLSDASLLVLDECSMVNDEMMDDLLSFEVPMLVLGDPGQLPPIEGEGALIRDDPDYKLTEIHRQAADNPIIDFATRARHGIYIPKLQRGTSAHLPQSVIKNDDIMQYDQILCGKNHTRKIINQKIRQLKGFTDIYPQVGDKLICLKNDQDKGLFNGMMCEVISVGELLDTAIEIEIRRETDTPSSIPQKIHALRAHFDAYHDKEALENVKWWDRTGNNEFDFGYAITVHKSQGSQWDKVLLWDDKFFVWKPSDRRKWLYTGITRAVESITIAS